MSKAKRYNPISKDKKPFFIKGLMLYILTLPLVFALFFALIGSGSVSIVTLGISTALYLLGATIARRGFLQEKEYNASNIAKAPKLKYKTAAAVILSFATFFTSLFATQNGMILSIVLALFFLAGFYLYYGFDPMEDKVKGELGIGVSAQEVIEITSRARKSVENLKEIENSIDDIEIKSIIRSVVKETEDVIEAIEKDPNDLFKARKFFNVYLYRTQQISNEYLKNLKKENIDLNLKENFKKLLLSVNDTICQQKAILSEDDIIRLDVQIEALTKQLKNEGV